MEFINGLSEVLNFNEISMSFYNFLVEVQKANKIILPKELLLPLKEVLGAIRKKYDELKSRKCLKEIMRLLYNVISINKQKSKDTIEITAEFLEQSINENCNTTEDIQLLLKLVYQILIAFHDIGITNDAAELSAWDGIFFKLQCYMFVDDKTICSLCLNCFELFLGKFRTNYVLENVWKTISQEKCSQITKVQTLTCLVDYLLVDNKVFKDCIFWELIYDNLQSNDEPIVRKHTIYLLRRTIEHLHTLTNEDSINIPGFFEWNTVEKDCLYKSWMVFLAIYENLEEKQSHLILPTLEMFPQICKIHKFKELIMSEILKHKNVLVTKWIIYYIMKSMKITEMTNDNLLESVLLGLNNTFLFGEENDLSTENLKNFVREDIERFIKVFPLIDWKPVPMHFCLQTLCALRKQNNNCSIKVNLKTLLDIAVKVRRIQNRLIRDCCIDLYFELFGVEFEEMTLNDLFNILYLLDNRNVITMYNVLLKFAENNQSNVEHLTSDLNIKTFKIVMKSCNKIEHKMFYFNLLLRNNPSLENLLEAMSIENLSQEIYMKLFENVLCSVLQIKVECNTMEKCFELIDTALYETFDYTTEFWLHYMKIHVILQLDASNVRVDATSEYNMAMKYQAKSSNTLNVLKQIFVDSFTQLMKIQQNYGWIFDNFERLIDTGGHRTLENIVEALYHAKNYVLSSQMFERILQELKTLIKKLGLHTFQKTFENLVKYFVDNLNDLAYSYLQRILDLDTENVALHKIIYKTVHNMMKFQLLSEEEDFLIRGLIFGEALHGDEKIEFEYIHCHIGLRNGDDASEVRFICLQILEEIDGSSQIERIAKERFLTDLTTKILTMSLELNSKKARYFDNSKQHRIKLRLTQALAMLQKFKPHWQNEFLLSILEENNQTNVSLIMELVIANSISWNQLLDLLAKISDIPASRQTSLLSIAYVFCRKHNNKDFIDSFIEIALPWTMGHNFATRLYAQISIEKLIKYFNLVDKYKYIYQAITKSLTQRTSKLPKEVVWETYLENINYQNLLDKQNILYVIPLITNMAVDEQFHKNLFDRTEAIPDIDMKCLVERKQASCSIAFESVIENVQRKMNPSKIERDLDFFYSESQFQQQKDTSIIVVGSLINKLPNLGGIARTCEVFGVDQLVLESLAFSETVDFKNLSMTAEKWLPIVEVKSNQLREYLNSKKLEGYQIVGAEQTKDSVSFTNFQFPRKSILLLGHEKEGIPANLISLLDYAVEIPQFGVVRSLNVHVTAALFMWEYRKQAILKGDMKSM